MKALIHFMCQPFAVHEPVLRSAAEIVERHLRGEKLPAERVALIVRERDQKRAEKERREGDEAVVAQDGGEGYAKRPFGSKADARGYYTVGATNSVAVVPIEGVICKYGSMINGMSQPDGTTTEAISEAVTAAAADPKVAKILLEIDSPGGVVAGLPEAAASIRDAAAVKPVIALANGMMASAAYWLGSQAHQLFASPEAAVGSIGVYTLLEDSSEMWAKKGVTFHLVKAGANKGIGAEGIPITKEQLAVVQSGVDAVYKNFVQAALIEGRKMSQSHAAQLADGRVHIGSDAVWLGLADGVKLKGQLIKEMDAMR